LATAVGGTSPASREGFHLRCRVEPTASREVEAAEPVDVVFAAPPSRGLEAGAAIGAALHASNLYLGTCSAIFDAKAAIGAVESDWSMVTAGAGGLLSKVRKLALARGYAIHHRLVSPHRLVGGGAAVSLDKVGPMLEEVFGGFAPFIVTWLTRASGSPVAPAWYVLFAASFGLLASVFMHDGAPCVVARRQFQGEPLSAK
jgi:hypothetical protein